jgi:hypothetical protein
MIKQETSFRPGLVILADETGKRIYQHLLTARFLDRLSVARQRCLGFIQLGTDADDPNNTSDKGNAADVQQVTYWLASERETYIQKDPLKEALLDILPQVRQIRSLNAVRGEGYQVPEGALQIAIVGAPRTDQMRAILQKVRDSLDERDADGTGSGVEIQYVLACHPASHDKTQGSLADNVRTLAQSDGITFCYTYGDIAELAYSEEEVCYAAAEALFALICTGITLLSEYVSARRVDPASGSYAYGTLSTALISFPREIARAYCSARMGALLVENWLREIKEATRSGASAQADAQAQQTAFEIGRLLHDGTPLPATHLAGSQLPWVRWLKLKKKAFAGTSANTSQDIAPALWPRVEPVSDDAQEDSTQSGDDQHQRACQKLLQETHALFEKISLSSIQQTRKRSQPWFDAAEAQHKDAHAKRESWQDAANAAWDSATTRATSLIERKVTELWAGGNGLAATVAYIEALDRELQAQKQQAQAAVGADPASPQQAEDQVVKERRARELHLKERAHASQEQVPTLKEWAWLGMIVLPLTLLMLRALFATWNAELRWLLPFAAGIMVVFILFALLFSFGEHRRQVLPVHIEIVNHYRACLIKECKQYEEHKRCEAIERLLLQMLCLKSSFLKARKVAFEETADHLAQALFETPAASRDIFVGYREYFAQNRDDADKALLKIVTITLNNTIFSKEAIIDHKEKFARGGKDCLLWAFQGDANSDIEMNQKFTSLINEYSLGLIDNFLQQHRPEMQYIDAAAYDRLWEGAHARLSHQLGSAQRVAQRPPTYFLCSGKETADWIQKMSGSSPALAGIAVDAATSQDWLLIAALSCCRKFSGASDNDLRSTSDNSGMDAAPDVTTDVVPDPDR